MLELDDAFGGQHETCSSSFFGLFRVQFIVFALQNENTFEILQQKCYRLWPVFLQNTLYLRFICWVYFFVAGCYNYIPF